VGACTHAGPFIHRVQFLTTWPTLALLKNHLYEHRSLSSQDDHNAPHPLSQLDHRSPSLSCKELLSRLVL
jgi:hypothetical protein